MVFGFFCFYLYLFNVPNSIHFDYLATLWMVLNWYPGVVKSLRLRKIICTVVLISETLRKKYWIWTVINGQMLVSQCEKEVRRLKWRLPLSAFHKAWLLTILSADLILFNLFVSLCSLSLALFWWNIKMKISFFCLSLLHLSLHLSPHLPLVFIFFSLSLSFSLLS